jgi:hypothetical protein
MYVLEIIKRILKNLFPSDKSTENVRVLMLEGDILMKNINQSKTLGQLMQSRMQLRRFKEAIDREESSQLRQKFVFLEARWNRQFRIWKTRGY